MTDFERWVKNSGCKVGGRVLIVHLPDDVQERHTHAYGAEGVVESIQTNYVFLNLSKDKHDLYNKFRCYHTELIVLGDEE